MIKNLLFLFTLFIMPDYLWAQNSFERVYGGLLPEVIRSAIPTSDGGILAGGSTRSFGNGDLLNTDFYLVKTNADGDTLWTRAFGTTSNDDGIAVAEFANGYVIAGTSINPLNGTNDFYVVKTDENGNMVWNEYYGGTGSEYCTNIIPLPDSTLVIYGTTTSFTNGGYDLYILKIDANGAQVTSANFGGTGNDSGYGIRRTQDGGFIMSGFSTSGLTTGDIYLAKIDSNLTFQWSRTFGGSGFDIGYDVEQADDGTYLVLGLWQHGPDSSVITLIKTDTEGLNAVMLYPGTHAGDYGYKLRKFPDGYAIAGFTNSAGKGSEMLLIRTNLNGDTLWSSHYGGTKNEVALGISSFSNGDILLAGETEGFGTDNFDGYLVRVNANGDVPCPDSASFIENDSSWCEDETVIFTNTTVSSQQFNWSVDGNSFSNDINAGYYFSEGGNYEVTLSTCAASSVQTIEIFSKPPSHFTYQVSGQMVTFFLSPSFTPASISWNFGDGSPVNTTDFNPTHTYSNAGQYWIVLSCTDSHGCDSTYAEQINLVTGINEPWANELSFFITPDPIHESGQIILKGNSIFPMEAKIFDLSGKMLKQFFVTKQQQQFSVARYDAGIYFFELTGCDGKTSVAKLIVQ